MPKGYTHLAYEQRCQIYALLKRGTSQKEIALVTGVDQSTISREISRNKGKRGYRYKQAQEKSQQRKLRASSRKRKMTLDVVMYVEQMLCNFQWSPEQISGRLKLQYNLHISHESIYQYIYKDKRKGGRLYKNLRRAGKKYNKRLGKRAGRGLIPGRIGIEERSIIVKEKSRIGDFELDTIIGAKHKGAIVSMVDRKSKITFLELIPNATAIQTSEAIISRLQPFEEHIHTCTADNGKEFAQHNIVSKKLSAQFFFANPYRSCERGLNENTNGLVRQYFPKKTDFTKLNAKQIRMVEYLLNSRPRKSLNYRTPIEIFLQETGDSINYALRC